MSVAPAGHVPVLLDEVLTLLSPRAGDVAVDCTLGRGGHAAAMARAVGLTGQIVGFEVDPANLDAARQAVEVTGVPFRGFRANFLEAARRLGELGLKADIVLADLGFASTQMDDSARGMSFNADGPLDMRLDPSNPVTAASLVASLSERELADLIFEYGEDPYARRIAQKLAQTRSREPILSTAQLARAVVEAYGSRAHASRVHPATRTFMALRIAVNDELGALRGLLDQIARGLIQPDGWLNPGARIGIISFHSLEDRLVKRCFADLESRGLAERVTRKPVTAGQAEQAANPRSRSAKLRVVKIVDPRQSGHVG